MSEYNLTTDLYTGTLDVSSQSIAPRISFFNGDWENEGYMKSGKGEGFSFQLYSDDISADVTWRVEVSLDGENWATHKDAYGDNVNGTLTSGTPVVKSIHLPRGVFARVYLVLEGQTGNCSYKMRPFGVLENSVQGALLNPDESTSDYVTEDGEVVDTSKNYLTDSNGNLILDNNENAITV